MTVTPPVVTKPPVISLGGRPARRITRPFEDLREKDEKKKDDDDDEKRKHEPRR